MPLLMPVVEKEMDPVGRDDPTRTDTIGETSSMDVIEFDPRRIHARGSTMAEAVLSAVNQVWKRVDEMRDEERAHERLSWELSGEIDVRSMAPMDTQPVSCRRAESACVEVRIGGPVDETRWISEQRARDATGSIDEGADDLLSSDRVARKFEGFSEQEEAFFDGYEIEEPLAQEELVSMFDPARAWNERRADNGGAGGRKADRRSRYGLFSWLW